MAKLLSLYNELCTYCDSLYDAILAKYSGDIGCKPGCSQCCTLRSVTRLEAYAIENYLQEHRHESLGQAEAGFCVFLKKGLCGIYPARPIICRTHGLILYDSSSGAIQKTCEMNFRQEEDTSRTVTAIDSYKIAENLLRLNLAFIKMNDENDDYQARVSLRKIRKQYEEAERAMMRGE